MVITDHEQDCHVGDRSVSISITLSELERRDARGQFFRWISFIMLVPFELERPNSFIHSSFITPKQHE